MDIVKLAQKAITVINQPVSNNIFLRMPGKWGKSNHRYLASKGSPKGTIVQSFVGEILVSFDAIEILAWCMAASDGKITIVEPAAEQINGADQ